MSSRAERQQIAEATLRTITTCVHTHEDVEINVQESLDACTSGTRLYPANCTLAPPTGERFETVFEVREEGTLDAARRLVVMRGRRPVALNFASAKHPGGGFLNGAQAQEENLARNSLLYAALTSPAAQPFYIRGGAKGRGDAGLYTHNILYSPHVPVVRTDDSTLLEPWPCSFITAAAPNAGVARRCGVSEREIAETMATRAARVLAVAAREGHREIVLGAWGCGVFRNQPEAVADAFARLLRGPFAGAFEHVSFAILGPEANRAPFAARFGGGASGEAGAAPASEVPAPGDGEVRRQRRTDRSLHGVREQRRASARHFHTYTEETGDGHDGEAQGRAGGGGEGERSGE